MAGLYDFNGQYTSPTFTAHPKIDPDNGELITMGYEARGDVTNDVAYYLFDKNGKKLEECWFKTPYVGMMHDMAATKNWIIFILPPLEARSLDDIKKGEKHFAWSEKQHLMFGILPRRNPKPEDIRWFQADNAFYGHTGNAFEGDDGCIYLDAPLTYHNKVSDPGLSITRGPVSNLYLFLVLVLSSRWGGRLHPFQRQAPSRRQTREPLRPLEV